MTHFPYGLEVFLVKKIPETSWMPFFCKVWNLWDAGFCEVAIERIANKLHISISVFVPILIVENSIKERTVINQIMNVFP